MNDTLAAEAAERYGVTASQLHPMSGGHCTSVYEVSLDSRACVLRIIPPGEGASLQEVRATHAWMSYLAERGAPVPRPVLALDGKAVSVITVNGKPYTLVATTKARGVLAETLSQDRWTRTYFRNIGAVAGKIHALAQEYGPEVSLRRPEWDHFGDLFSADQPAAPSVQAKKRCVLAQINALPKTPDVYGMTHGDFHFGNFFVDPEVSYEVTVFDFDDCAYGWYIMDTAILLFDILVLYEGPAREAFADEFLRSYLSGYRSRNPLPPFWVDQLPLFLKLLEISYYTMLEPGYSATDNTDFWVARFMPGRKERVENDLPYVALDFHQLAE